MKKSLLSGAAVALVLTAGSALAADLPSMKGPPAYIPPPPLLTWTGFYVGLNAGYTFGNSNNTAVASAPVFAFAGAGGPNLSAAVTAASNFAASSNNDGFIGGGQIGYNWQFMNNFVAGVEADIQGLASSGSSGNFVTAVGVPGFPNTVVQSATVSKSLDYLGTVRGRLGYLVTPSLLVYGTGGLAYGGVNSTTAIAHFLVPPAAVSPAWFSAGAFSDTRVGWTAGGGVEWMFMPNWSAKVEYMYYDLGNVTYASSPLVSVAAASNPFTVNAVQSTTRFDGHVVRAGVNYHFNWGSAPVLAKY